MKDKLWLKILIPILIVLVVAGIFIVKNEQKAEDTPSAPQDDSHLSDELKNADFSLRSTTAINFEELSKFGLPIIVDYGADTCIPCKAMAPVPSDALAAEIEFTMYSDKNTNEHIFTVHQGGLTEEEMWSILAEMGVNPDD